jgi:excisionase family DNA binding protein
VANTTSRPTQTRISLDDAATRLGVSVWTIRRRIADGTLPAYRVGKRLIRVDPRDLDRLERAIPAVVRDAE